MSINRLVFVIALSSFSGFAWAQQSLNVVSWDGAYVKSQILGFIRPWERVTGNRVNVIQYTGGIDEIRKQVRAWNVSWDVVDLELFDAIRACKEGLLEPINFASLPAAPDGTPAEKDFINAQATSCGVGNVVGSTVVSFRNERFEQNPPSQLEDFFDTNRYPGRRGLRKSPQGNLEWALIADGVPVKDVYKVLASAQGVDRALAKLNKIKPHIVWWESGQDAIRLLELNDVVMTSVYSGRVASARERGQDIKIVWDHQVWYYDVWGIPKNGRNVKLAHEFVRYATSTESLAAQAKYIPYGPMRRSSMALLDDELRKSLPTSMSHLQSAVELDAQWWSANLDRVAPRFERWLQRPVRVPKALPR